jgi:hypothetical protein
MKKKSSVKKVIGQAKKLTGQSWYEVILEKRTYHTTNKQPIVAPAICVTKFGDLLELYGKNREIKLSHSKVSGESITKLASILRMVVVVKIGNRYYIADGQHLYTFLVSENMPIEFILIEVKTEKELINVMRLMNSSSKRWGLPQFVNVNTNDKKDNAYNKLQQYTNDYYERTGMTTKVMAALMFNEMFYKEPAASKAITGDYFVQNVPDVRLKERLNCLKRFYRVTKMTPTNYLNAGFFTLMYEKRDLYKRNEKQFLQSVSEYAKKYKLLTLKYGNKEDAKQMLNNCWAKV